MALKGSAKIQLFDAKTGKLERTIESNNIITNAVTNILNGALNALAISDNNGFGRHYSLNYLLDLPSGYNLAKALMGGLLVFSCNIEENAEHIIPSISEMKAFIGCGNQGSSIDGSIFKGSLNESESSMTDKSITFVWSFSAEQCNGNIGCLCLTSNKGGHLGFKFNVLDSSNYGNVLSYLCDGMWDVTKSLDFSTRYIHNPMFKSSFTNSNRHGVFIDSTNYKYVYRNNVYVSIIGKLLDSNKVGFELTDNFAFGNKNYDASYPIENYSDNIFTCTDSDKVYEIDIKQQSIIGDKEKNLYLYKIYDSFTYYEKNTDGSVSSNLKYYITGLKFWLIGINTDDVVFDATSLLKSIYSYHGVSYEEDKTFYADDANGNDYTYEYTEFTASSVLIDFRDNAVIHNNKIYFLTGRVNDSNLVSNPNKLRMYVVSFNGSFTYKDINCTDTIVSMLFGASSIGGKVTSNMNVTFTKFFDNLVLVSKDYTNGYKYFIVNEDGSIDDYPFTACKDNLSYYGYDLYKNSLWLKEPWCSFKFAGNGFYNSVEMWSTYLATINNQVSGLVKTNKQTMKITYTLTQL